MSVNTQVNYANKDLMLRYINMCLYYFTAGWMVHRKPWEASNFAICSHSFISRLDVG